MKLADEIKFAYNELKNETAQSQFGIPYPSLKENSSEKKRIDEAYPMKLSAYCNQYRLLRASLPDV